MNSISNDHPSAYYHCDYKPFVYFIVALNLRGFNECWDVKLSPPRMGRSQGLFDVAQGVLCSFTHSSLLFVSLFSSQPSTSVRIIHGLCRDDNASCVFF